MAKTHKRLPSTAVQELTRRHGAVRVSKMLGVAESTIHMARKEGTCAHALELAARYCLSKEDKETGAKHLLGLCRVPASKKEVFETLMRGMELKWSWFKEDE